MLNSHGRKRVAVIGGGISGLTAAFQLRKMSPELDVLLFESDSRLGGVIQTTEKDGFLIEGAADNFITISPAAIELCHDLGLGDELIRTNSQGQGAMVVSQGRLQPIPPGFMVMAPSRIWPLLSTKILSTKGKLRSGCEIFVPRRRRMDDESLQSFVCRRFGREMFERLVQPLVGSIYTADPSRLSLAATMPRFMEMERRHGSLIRGMIKSRRHQAGSADNRGGARYSQFMTLRGGMSQLIETLGERLPADSVRLESRVRRLIRRDAGWTIELDSNTRFNADAIIVATPARHASRLLCDVDTTMAEELLQIPFASCAVVSLAFRREQIGAPFDSFGFVVPRIEDHFILSCSFSSNKYQGRAPEGTVLMRVFIGGATQPGLLRLSNVELMELAHWELARLLDIEGEPMMKHITLQRHAMPQYHLGHNERVARINQRLASHPTLALAGSSLTGVGVPACISSGQEAAQKIVQAFRADSKEMIHHPELAGLSNELL